MARRHEAVEWLRKGYSPSEIAKKMNVTVSTVMNYLYNQVGEGNIRRSDIVFAMDEKKRDAIEAIISKYGTSSWHKIYRKIERTGVSMDKDDLIIYLKLRDARVAFGDMYEFIRDIEVNLHDLVKSTLLSEYSEDWWRKGVPKQIRVECATSREEDPEPASEAYSYTTFMHLGKILENQWGIFRETLPKRLASNRREMVQRLEKLNHIRNSVMHPIKDIQLTDKEFTFVRKLRADFGL
ncbi:MAG: helix-turn-helix domain-containing protein [Candidatus Bathyarchaeia archaeon]